MKILFILFGSLYLNIQLIAQHCDIYATKIRQVAESLVEGQSTDLTFSILNDSKSTSCAYAAQSVNVIMSLPSSGIAFESIISPANGKGDFFTWTYNSDNQTVTGINHSPIGDLEGDKDVTIRIKASVNNTSAYFRTIGVSIVQHHEGAAFPSNNEWNDNQLTTLRLSARESFVLGDFNAINTECNVINISLVTFTENNSDYMEIQRSLDDLEYSTIKEFKGTNTNSKTSYNFTDVNDLIMGEKYYYRLKQISTNGSEKVFKSISVENNCLQKEIDLNLYPNPAFDKIFITLKGVTYFNNVKLQVTNASGEQVKLISPVSFADPIELMLNDFPSGIYNVTILGISDLVSKRFIKID